jgi:hypothetical protein
MHIYCMWIICEFVEIVLRRSLMFLKSKFSQKVLGMKSVNSMIGCFEFVWRHLM